MGWEIEMLSRLGVAAVVLGFAAGRNPLRAVDRYAVIKAQIPTALPLLIVNVVLMYALAFR